MNALTALVRAGHEDLAERLAVALFGKKPDPQRYLKKHGRCPAGYHQEGGRCEPHVDPKDPSAVDDALRRANQSGDDRQRRAAQAIHRLRGQIRELQDAASKITDEDRVGRIKRQIYTLRQDIARYADLIK